MITVADIVNRSLARAGQPQIGDNDIHTHCEWCNADLTLAACEQSKTGPDLLYRCPTCADVLLIVNRHRESPPPTMSNGPARKALRERRLALN